MPAHLKRESKLVPNAAKRSSVKWAAAGAMIFRHSRRQLRPALIACVPRVWRKQLNISVQKNHEAMRLHID
jgi:hypothetical protein